MVDFNASDPPLNYDIIELEERLEFGAAIIDSDLDGDTNSSCTNPSSCGSKDNVGCTNITC